MIKYYIKILFPIPLITWAAFYDGTWFLILMVLYIIYRQLVDANKLYKKGIINRNEMWFPLLSVRYFKDLYLS